MYTFNRNVIVCLLSSLLFFICTIRSLFSRGWIGRNMVNVINEQANPANCGARYNWKKEKASLAMEIREPLAE